jgi:dihydroxyacetone kinase
MMKKLLNSPVDAVPEMLAGLVARSPGLTLLEDHNVVVRTDIGLVREREVALISGGGSGHEPAHAGYVGSGMLHAAVCGDVFASPSVDAVLAAIRAVCGAPGALLIVKNYTGDRLNFGLAAEIARAAGFRVEMILVADDVALDVPIETRRGIAGAVLVHKVTGALAATGAPLAEVTAAARAVAASLGTMGVALGPCIVPAAGTPSFTLGDSEIELGLGIHGEAGLRRIEIAPARELVAELLSKIVTIGKLIAGDRVALMVNDLGSTPPMELDIVTNMALTYLDAHGLHVERVWCGRFLTSLEMPGISLSLLAVDDDRLRLLDAATKAPAWPNAALPGRIDVHRARLPTERVEAQEPTPHADGRENAPLFRASLDAIVRVLLASEARLTELDQVVGDGDLGISLARAARAIQMNMDRLDMDDPAASLAAIAGYIREAVGGTSGPLYSIFVLRGALSLAKASRLDAKSWSDAFLAGCDGIAQLGGATVGDRTMLDALEPAARQFSESIRRGNTVDVALSAAVVAARDGAAATATMVARRGRSQYLGERVLSHVDPGAAAAALWLDALGTVNAQYATS